MDQDVIDRLSEIIAGLRGMLPQSAAQTGATGLAGAIPDPGAA